MKGIITLSILSLCCAVYAQIPQFGIRSASGEWHWYSQEMVDDDLITAALSHENDIWTLSLTANAPISSIKFPYESERHPLDGDISDDIYYYPVLGGGTVQAPYHNVDFNWFGLKYPGEIFAPLVVITDADNARIIAATNWPPRTVTPLYAAERVQLAYDDINLATGDNISLSCLIAEVNADPTQGEKAWQEALDLYRNWLYQYIDAPTYPAAMEELHGYIFIGLTDWPAFDLTEISETWLQWRDRLPWMQIWGQMSNYAGPPHLAIPPLKPGEITDCCYAEYEMHPRYVPELIEFMEDSIVSLGYWGGFYSSPYLDIWDSWDQLLLDTPLGIEWLAGWLDKNELEYKANAFYVDILGRRFWGDPPTVMDHFTNGLIREMTIIEGLVDIYPAAGLLSGNLVGMAGFPGGPGITPENSIEASFPAMQRYLLNDRIVFMGPSNGDAVFMGPTADYWMERQAFLLGAKFETSHPNDNWNPNTPSPALTLAIEARDAANWWQRQPRYLDTKRIIDQPEGIEVRRFIDNAGCDLFVIDNWNELVSTSFTFAGQTFDIPQQKLSIIDRCETTAVNYLEDDESFMIYPNPSSALINLKMNFDLNDPKVIIYSHLGQPIKEFSNISQQSITINTVDLPAGIYFIEVMNDEQFVGTKRIVVSK